MRIQPDIFARPAAWITAMFLAVSCAVITSAEEFPEELTRFQPYPGNPVFSGAGEGKWDVKIRERGWVLRESDVWRMWYTGYDGTREGLRRLGYATSKDGLEWKRERLTPISKEGEWVEDVCLIRKKERYYMAAEGFQDRARLLTSPDGLDWHVEGHLAIQMADGSPLSDGPYGTPTLWQEAGKWYLFYERRDEHIWLASSQDLKTWRNVQDEPVLSPGGGEYDRDMVAMNQIVKYEGKYYAVYHGGNSSQVPTRWSTGIAVSDDLKSWRKYAGNPLLPMAENKSSGVLVHDGERFRLYTMHAKVDVHFSIKASQPLMVVP